MKSNLLQIKINSLQERYADLLSILLPKLKSNYAAEALDEINLFWIRNINIVRLYLKTLFPGQNSYVFTAATYLDFDDKDHLPFLLMGDKHILDDPLCKYSEICKKMSTGKDSRYLYRQIEITAEHNLKLLENVKSHILILPLRLLNQSDIYDSLYHVGEQAFVSLFDGIKDLSDYFEKCNSIVDIMQNARADIGRLVMFTEDDDSSLPFEKRFKAALSDIEYMIDPNGPDSYNFFILVFGCIQQAIDVIASCVEYGCIPYIRYPVALHYILLLSESMEGIELIEILRYKMSVAFAVCKCCNREKLIAVSFDEFLRIKQEYQFSERLFCYLNRHGINEQNVFDHEIWELVVEELERFYEALKC